jgi:predicted adenylyl cyclase CyaB
LPRNIEIKARLADLAATRRRVAGAADRGPEHLTQTDTFFQVPGGRLKVRECSGRPPELIHYRRPDTPGPSESEWAKVAVPDAAALRELLGAALGVRGQVVKQRTLFWVGRTRVHLDEVRDLGDFLELEVVLEAGEAVAAGIEEAQRLLRVFGIPGDALVPEAYVDLLEASRRAAATPAGSPSAGSSSPSAVPTRAGS